MLTSRSFTMRGWIRANRLPTMYYLYLGWKKLEFYGLIKATGGFFEYLSTTCYCRVQHVKCQVIFGRFQHHFIALVFSVIFSNFLRSFGDFFFECIGSIPPWGKTSISCSENCCIIIKACTMQHIKLSVQKK